MNKAETAYLLQTIIAMFPGTKMTADELTVSIWQEMLSDLPAELALNAAKRVCATKKFPACIADIREAAAEAVREQEGALSPGEAWAKVRKAIGAYGYYRPTQAREALGEEIWQAVEMTGGWSEMCMNESGVGVLSAQFVKRYEAAQQQREKRMLIPAAIREDMNRLVAPLAERMQIEGAAMPGAGANAD